MSEQTSHASISIKRRDAPYWLQQLIDYGHDGYFISIEIRRDEWVVFMEKDRAFSKSKFYTEIFTAADVPPESILVDTIRRGREIVDEERDDG